MNYLFKSQRLGFRLISKDDINSIFEINSSPIEMKYFLKSLNKDENLNYINKLYTHFLENKFTLFAVDLLSTKEFIGLIGLLKVSFDLDIKDQIEIGWRLNHKYWGNGYAQEGARAVLDFGFNQLDLNTIYAFTSILNLKSENVMKKIGMEKVGEFEHPLVPNYSSLLPHILYKINKRA